jgi:hypothetical protein
VEYKLYDNIEEIMAAINKGEGHIVYCLATALKAALYFGNLLVIRFR